MARRLTSNRTRFFVAATRQPFPRRPTPSSRQPTPICHRAWQADIWDCPDALTTSAAAADYIAAAAEEGGGSGGGGGRRKAHYLLRRLYTANRRDFWLSACYRGGQEVAQLCQPLLLAQILHFLETPEVGCTAFP